ncbi:hypothetical protein [Salmonella phage SD-1_S14]|nr:hypothetical protein [Salmonella phage SD-2_S15]WPK19478.1 hypothetical protein [Salmonella phage SD-6_S16]WPK20149.1 hypothetical protein [Salmonella phage SD-1_S14]WPK21157.1 hypothetical protein [Salmonella phage SD-15_S21]
MIHVTLINKHYITFLRFVYKVNKDIPDLFWRQS